MWTLELTPFGKWHLGSEGGRLPNDQGFDEWYGIPRTTDEALWPSEPATVAASVPFELSFDNLKSTENQTMKRFTMVCSASWLFL
jgi:arylsulfatase